MVLNDAVERDEVFPAGAGMNRSSMSIVLYQSSVPRRRGDEPTFRFMGSKQDRCSPQARG